MVYKIALLFSTIASFNFSIAMADANPEKPIVVVITSYNNEKWVQWNLSSVLTQKYENYRAIYVNDASTDETGFLVSEYLFNNDAENKVTLIQNEKNLGALANIYNAVWMCDPSEIVVSLDGDDWLANDLVLQFVNDAYSDPDVWMTYGQYNSYPQGYGFGAKPLPHSVIENNCYRSYDWVTTHLRTFYAGLFQKIKKEDLMYEGKFYPTVWDLPLMYPMLEMSGFHSRFIPNVLYIYNVARAKRPSDFYGSFHRLLESTIRSKEPYEPLSEPPYICR